MEQNIPEIILALLGIVGTLAATVKIAVGSWNPFRAMPASARQKEVEWLKREVEKAHDQTRRVEREAQDRLRKQEREDMLARLEAISQRQRTTEQDVKALAAGVAKLGAEIGQRLKGR